MARTFKVKGWEKHQHYKDRNPPWIRFYNTTLDDYEVAHLPDVAKAHLFGIWLLASRYENIIPYDANWIGKKINATSPVDLDQLTSLGLIEIIGARTKPLARRKQLAVPETEANTEGEKKEPPKAPKGAVVYPESFEGFWKAYPSRGTAANPKHPAFLKWEQTVKDGMEPSELTAAALRYRVNIGEKNGTEFVVQTTRWFKEKRYLDAPAPVAAEPPVRTEDTQWLARCIGFAKNGHWLKDQWGPKPTEPGCRAPEKIVAETNADGLTPPQISHPNVSVVGNA